MGVFLCATDFRLTRFDLPDKKLLALLCAAVVMACSVPTRAQLVVNELYYDHPGSDAGYEFIEIINVSGAVVLVSGVELQFHNGTGVGWESLWHGDEGEIAPGGLYVVGGRYVFPAPDAVAGFSLQNGPDAVRVTVDGAPADVLAYGSLQDDDYSEGSSAPGVEAGLSLARMPDGDDSDDNAADFDVADPSPGQFNLARFDADIDVAGATRPSAVLPPDGMDLVELLITNKGQEAIFAAAASVELWDSSGSSSELLARGSNAAPLPPGEAEALAFGVLLSPGYHWVTARVHYAADERSGNDRITLLRRVGGPKLLVSEILCYPVDGCPQFVELFNAGTTAADISGFRLRDRSHEPTTITNQAVTVAAGGYLAVTPDAAALLSFFPHTPADRLVEHAGTWPTLNRTGTGGESDSVVVTDELFLPVDAVSYPPVDSDYAGRSLERIDLYPGRSTQTWVLSPESPGASPGRAGSRSLFEPPAPGSLEVSPRTFSPWSGETMTVSVDAPDGTRAILSVYDVEGRRLAELGGAMAFPAVFVWDGRHSGGRRMVPGLYIVVCESFSPAGERFATRKVVVGCARRGG